MNICILDPETGIDEPDIEGYTILRGNGSSLIGGSDNEIILGTDADEHIEGGGGSDIIFTGNGRDTVFAEEDDQVYVGPQGLASIGYNVDDGVEFVKQLAFFKSFREKAFSLLAIQRVRDAYHKKYNLNNPIFLAAAQYQQEGKMAVITSHPDDINAWYEAASRLNDENGNVRKQARSEVFKVVRAEYPVLSNGQNTGQVAYKYLVNIFAPANNPLLVADIWHLALKEVLDVSDPTWLGKQDDAFITLVQDKLPGSAWNPNLDGNPTYDQAVGDMFEAAAATSELYLQGLAAISIGADIALTLDDTIASFKTQGVFAGVSTAVMRAFFLTMPAITPLGGRLLKTVSGTTLGRLVNDVVDLANTVLRTGDNAFDTPKLDIYVNEDWYPNIRFQAFENSTAVARRLDEDAIFYRYIPSNTSLDKTDLLGSGFVTTELFTSAEEATRKLALPNSNDAGQIVMIRIEAGAEVISGTVRGRTDDLEDYGTYAVGGGQQIYILDRDKASILELGQVAE